MASALVVMIAGCGAHHEVAPPSAAEVCAALAKSPAVAGDHGVTVARVAATTVGRAKTWLGTRSSGGSRGIDASTFVVLNTPETTPLDVCVFRSAKELPISRPPGNKIRFNGIRVLAQNVELFVTDAYGDADQLVAGLDTL